MWKIISVNIVVLLVLFALANIASFGVLFLMPRNKAVAAAGSDPRLEYPNLRGLDWAAKHFSELNSLEMEYHSFIGWKRKPFKGETVQISEDGLRASAAPKATSTENIVALFGGSTMWGSGVRDEDTIPSFLNKIQNNFLAVNYGETGYRAHQSYNRMMGEVVRGSRFSKAIFYDGVNDVYTGCLDGADVYAHFFDGQFRDIIEYFNEVVRNSGGAAPVSTTPSPYTLVQPIVDVIDRWSGREARSVLQRDRVAAILSRGASFRCDTDPERAHAVARMLVEDWIAAASLAKRHGMGFTAVLQPLAYLGKSRVDYLGLMNDANARTRLAQQYETVYPIIREMAMKAAAKHGFDFIDMTASLDVANAPFYIDFCHLDPSGNRRIAEQLAATVLRPKP